jgi:hypothetical protein
MQKGTIVPKIPDTRRGKSEYDWDSHAEQARQVWPNALLAETHVHTTVVNAVRQYRSRQFRNEDGHVVVSLRNSKVDTDGERYGEVYMQWVPNERGTDGATPSSN